MDPVQSYPSGPKPNLARTRSGYGPSNTGSLDDLMFKLLTGRSQGDIQEIAALQEMSEGQDDTPNYNAHRIASKLMADRIGSFPAKTVGVGWEVMAGLKQKLAGKPFHGEIGYSPEDVAANFEGADAAQMPPALTALLNAQRQGEDPLLKAIELGLIKLKK